MSQNVKRMYPRLRVYRLDRDSNISIQWWAINLVNSNGLPRYMAGAHTFGEVLDLVNTMLRLENPTYTPKN